MLRTVVVLSIFSLVAVVGTALTGPFWLTVVSLAGALMLGATALSLVRPLEEDGTEVDAGADVHPLFRPRGHPGAGLSASTTDGLGRAA